MRTLQTAILAGVIAAGFAGSLLADPAEDLFAKTHKGAKESNVASGWYDALPEWVDSLVGKNHFLHTHLPYTVDRPGKDGLGRAKPSKDANKFEIRDADKRTFSAYEMMRNGVDAKGLPVYKTTENHILLPWKSWPAKYIVETYPVDNNRDDAALVAFGAWLYGEKENDLANRVLTVVHQRNTDLAPLIAAYICDKEHWDLPSDGMKVWDSWDIEYQKVRKILVTPDEYEKRLKQREKDAKDQFKQLVGERGDYKGKPPRRKSPTKQLALLEWEIKQYKIKFGNSDFLKDTGNTDKLQEILDSIKDDLAVIKENLDKARDMGKSGNPNDLEAKAEFMENVLRIDPMDLNLRSQVANCWYAWGKPADNGNNCDRSQGIKKAIPHYEIILRAYPNNTAFLIAMGRCYQALQDSSHARKYYDKVIELEGDKGYGPTAKALIRNMDLKDKNRSQHKGK